MIIFLGLVMFFTFCYAALMLLYSGGWLATPRARAIQYYPKTSVAVVVAARNEEQNIISCINDILNQNYPGDLLSLIVVDDFSNDGTAEKLKSVIDSRIKIISMSHIVKEEKESSKKRALEAAIESTQATLIITTDADCRMGKDWLRAMVAEYELNHKQFIMGPVAFRSEKKLFGKMQSLDMFGYAGIACGSLFWKIPALCNGANLAYTRELFQNVSGFINNRHLLSGDDMFLLIKAFQKNPGTVTWLKSTEAMVYTQPMHSWASFINQRVRWASKSKFYSDKKITLALALVFLFYMSLFATMIYSFFNPLMWLVLLFMMLTKAFLDFILLYHVTNFFGAKKLMRVFLPALIFHIGYVFASGILSQVKSYNWKGRKN